MPRSQTFRSIFLLLTMLGSASAFAYEKTGVVAGTIVDQTGAAIAGATIQANDIDHSVTFATRTDDTGSFLLSVPIGHYQIVTLKSGFGNLKSQVFEVAPNDVARVDLVLQARGTVNYVVYATPPQKTEDIEVDAMIELQPLEPMPLVRTRTLLQLNGSELRTIIDSYAIERLPL